MIIEPVCEKNGKLDLKPYTGKEIKTCEEISSLSTTNRYGKESNKK